VKLLLLPETRNRAKTKAKPSVGDVAINADAGHKATTRRAVMAQASQNGHSSAVVSGRYEGVFGYGNAIAALFDAALALARGEEVDQKVYIPFELVTPANIDDYLEKN